MHVCCFSCSSSGEADDNRGTEPSRGSAMRVRRGGPHGIHAVASRRVRAGDVIVRCSPLAHSLLVKPMGIDFDPGGDDGGGGGAAAMSERETSLRCAHCFAKTMVGGDGAGAGAARTRLSRCSKCRVAHYCSRHCQANDWNQHKLECKYYRKKLRRQKHSTRCVISSNGAEEDTVPLLLRTFSVLKSMRDDEEKESISGEKDGALTSHAPGAASRRVERFGTCRILESSNNKHGDIVACGPEHFASLIVSPMFDAPSSFAKSMHLSGARTDARGLQLAKDLMNSFAGGGNEGNGKKAEGAAGSALSAAAAGKFDRDRSVSSAADDAAVGVWGYRHSTSASDTSEFSDGSDVVDESSAFQYTVDLAIERTLDAFRKNNFGIVNSLHVLIGEGVYPSAALLNHSCHPNCVLRYELDEHDFDAQPRPPILRIVACRDIEPGEEFCHSYVDLALPTRERRRRLQEVHGFVCDCARCRGKCSVELPADRRRWPLWPLECGLDRCGRHNKIGDSGGAECNNIETGLMKFELDEVMTDRVGINDSIQNTIFQQTRALQGEAQRCMLDDDTDGELRHLRNAVAFFTGDDAPRFSPFHVELYSIRGMYLSALLANGHIVEAVIECEHIVSFLVVAFHRVPNHPMLGLQLYTLGDLYTAAADMGGISNADRRRYEDRAMSVFSWAKGVMAITHGHDDIMVKTLDEKLKTN